MTPPPPPPPADALTDTPQKKKPWSKPTVMVINDGVAEVGAGGDPSSTEAMQGPTTAYIIS